MKKFYRINNHRNRVSPLYSVDEVLEDGHCVCQAAFFYRTRSDAFKAARRIIAEDQAGGTDSSFQPGKEESVCGWTS